MFEKKEESDKWLNTKLQEQNRDLWAKYGNLKRFVDKLEARVTDLEHMVEEETEEVEEA